MEASIEAGQLVDMENVYIYFQQALHPMLLKGRQYGSWSTV